MYRNKRRAEASESRRRRSVSRGRLSFEPLEARLVLDGYGPVISEFMAINDHPTEGLRDGDGELSDWLEIHNPGTQTVDLTGWKLQDSGNDWTFPAVSLGPGEFRVIFASDKDRRDPAAELHTNFKLSGGGEYLGLIDDQGTVIHEYNEFPPQIADVSYGIGQDVDTTYFVATGDSATYLVPGSDQGDWTSIDHDDGAWDVGKTGIGFADTVAGFAVYNYTANTDVGNLDIAQSVLDNPAMQIGSWSENRDVINYWNSDGHGRYLSGEVDFPGLTGVADNFVLKATGFVAIPSAGQWSFGVNSDDGFRLTIPGVTTSAVGNSNTAAGSDTISFYNPRGNGDTLGAFSFPTAGTYPLELVYYERGGGASVELFAAQGSYTSFDTGAFRLVGDTAAGGLAVGSEPISGGGTGSTFTGLVATDVENEMKDGNASMFLRFSFDVAVPTDYQSLTLKMKYDDGYIAYLNGHQIAERNAPAAPTWNSAATAEQTDEQATAWENVDVSDYLGHLVAGPNVLAVHAMNRTAGDGDFLVLPELVQITYEGLGEHFFASATPGDVNASEDWLHVEDTTFSHDRGFYDEPFLLEISTPTVGADVYYTIDGSEPSETDGLLYTTPVPITTTTVVRAIATKTAYEPTNVDTQTYIFLNDVLHQPVNPSGFPATWGGTTADYEMDPDVVNNPLYSDQMKDSLLSLPSMSIVTGINNLFGSSGIYQNSGSEGAAWEKPTSVEWINTDGTTGFQVDAGLRIYGGAFRGMNLTRKKSFRLLFKGEYGPTKLNFPLFEGSDPENTNAATRFDTIILRAGANDAWNNWGKNNTQYIVDEFMRRTELAFGQPASHGTYVHLYVNGLYWGLYNPVERPEASFSATYFGGEKEEWDALNSASPTGESNTTTWNAMLAQVRAGLSDMASYQKIQGNNPDGTNNPDYDDLLDVDNLIDYMLSNFWGGTGDWPSHNWYGAARRPPNATGYKFFNWDSEGAIIVWSDLNANRTGVNNANSPAEPYIELRNNAEFRMLFADHVHRQMFNGGPGTADVSRARYQELSDQVEAAIISESARWGDQASATPYTQASWASRRDYVLNTYMPQRPAIVLQQLKNINLYPNVVAPSFNINGSYQHGGIIELDDALSIDAPAGTIYYTTDGSDPRPLGGGAPDVGDAYGGPVTLNQGTHVKARVYSGGTWSALNESTYYVDLTPDIRISEIMYNPAAPTPAEVTAGFTDKEAFEFIEITNISATDVLPLEGLRFGDGIDFTFPDVSIAPGEYVVAVKNEAAFNARYPGLADKVAGTYTGWLNNEGEWIELDSPIGGIVQQLRYNDGWYDHTDGDGFSLSIRDPYSAAGSEGHSAAGSEGHSAAGSEGHSAAEFWSTSDAWRASAAPGGTPGSDDVLIAPGSVVVNEVLAHSNFPLFDSIELHNTADSSIDVSGWYLSDQKTDEAGNEVLAKYQIPTMPPIESGGYRMLYENAHFGATFALSELGDDVYLSSNAGGTAGGYREHVDFGASPANRSIGLHTKSTGGTDFTLLVTPTPEAANAAPYLEDLVINELGYHPSDPTAGEIAAGLINDDDFEFVEIYNTSTTTSYPLRDYYIGNGIGFTFGWYDAEDAPLQSQTAAWTLEQGATATWNAVLPASVDVYEVFARWDLLDPEGNPRDLDGQANYEITHQNGSTMVVRDQKPEADDEGSATMDPQGWVSLGSYYFDGSGQVVLSRGTNNPDNWTIADQVKFVGSSTTVTVEDAVLDSPYTAAGPATIGPEEYIVIARNYDAFDLRYDIAGNGITVVGEYTGNLGNDGEKVKLLHVGDPDPSGYIPYYRIDYVNYNDVAPWPLEPDGHGPTLGRSDAEAYGNDPSNWRSDVFYGTPGAANSALDTTPPIAPAGLAAEIGLMPATQVELTWDAVVDPDSYVDHYVVYRNGLAVGTSTSPAYTDADVTPVETYTYEVSAVNRDQYESAISTASSVTIPGIETYGVPAATTIRLTFNEPVVEASAESAANYTLAGAAIAHAELQGDGTTVLLTTSQLVPGDSYTLTVAGVSTLSGLPMPLTQQLRFDYYPSAAGAMLREVWTGLGGAAVWNLTLDADYPDNPYGKTYPISFEAPTGWGDDYGTRMRGYVHPPVSGLYTFWISSDDSSELLLSGDDDPAGATRIAYVNGATSWRNYSAQANQQSAAVYLSAGLRYYIEAVHKEGSGDDSLSVRWQLPGGTWEDPGDPAAPIPAARLTPFGTLPDVTSPSTPNDLSAVAVGSNRVDLRWSASVDPESGVDHYAIYRDGQPYDTSAGATYSDTDVAAGTRHTYQVMAVNADAFASPFSAAISVAPVGIASAEAPNSASVRLVFTEPLQRASAESAGNYQINGTTVLSAALQSDAFTVVVTTFAMASGTTHTVTVNNVQTISGDPMPTNLQASFQIGGTILWEYWTGIGGTAVGDLAGDPDYPDNPDGQAYYTLFETPTNWAEQYGGRMYGYLYPYATGNHTFWIATDDGGELWLSTDETPANKARIAHVPGWAGSRNWTK
ncbi:MAG: lamin tail domain-containing protein, partial [Candidatus Nealsonbacteria bacterium]|nr:lamin tail domain-containing protein [Candidatus Nealsonbacteria bacterium]